MAVTRFFLGWDSPLCETVPAWLLRHDASQTIDLRGTVVGMPTRQSSRRLGAALPLHAFKLHGAALLGPEIVTASVLIAPPLRAGCASELHAILAWCAVLHDIPSGELDAFLGKRRSQSNTWALQLARRLTRLRRELADGAMSIAEVAASGHTLHESERWLAMAELEQRYLDRLASWNLRDNVNDQLAYAREGQPASGIKHVVLAAVPDPPRLLITLLETWSQRGGQVSVLVAAPENEADTFDGWGRPLPAHWSERAIRLDDTHILTAANPEDQAVRIAGLIKTGLDPRPTLTGDRRPALAIGVPDRETVPPLQRELANLGLPAFDPRDRPLTATALFRLLQALLDWQDRSGYTETAALLRHPHVLEALPDAGAVLRGLDEVQSRHLPVTFKDLYRAAERCSAVDSDRQPGETHLNARALLKALQWMMEQSRQLRDQNLSDGLRTVLKAVYREKLLLPDRPADTTFQQAAETVDTALRELADAEQSGQAGSQAAAVLLARLQGMTVKAERAAEPLDLEGWLELAWNPAPVLCVAGMNEGFVPDSHTGDFFLPDSLRHALNLRDDRLRVARDAYLLTAMCAQRANLNQSPTPQVVLLVGKRSTAGDPLRPSRLLFRCPDDTLLQRARNLFSDPPPEQEAAAHGFSFQLDPGLLPHDNVNQRLRRYMAPTAFRDYLQCPFRFYLKRVLGMTAADDRAREPDAMAFGNLCHATLDAMGRDSRRPWACGDAVLLGDWLEKKLRESAVELYGNTPWLGVTMAVESAVARLHALARQQVAWHAQGWDIIETESTGFKTTLNEIVIGGRIDRIDRNRLNDAVCVLDYKTTESAVKPRDIHLAPAGDESFLPQALLPADAIADNGSGRRSSTRRWIDLQLPLYHEMVRPVYGPDTAIGYILLPAALGDTTFALWDGYNDALHNRALDCARALIDLIKDGIFWPPSPRPLKFEDFSDMTFSEPVKTFVQPPNPWRNA